MQRCSLSVSRRVLPKPKPRAYSSFAHRAGQARQEPEHIPIARSDPFALVASELTLIRERLLSLLGSAHPDLHTTAEYFFLQPSVQLRSLLILLFSRATNGLGGSWQRKIWDANRECSTGQGIRTDVALQDPSTLRDWYPTIPDHTASFSSVFELQKPTGQNETPLGAPTLSSYTAPVILPTQIRLGQIMEMVHVASLLHNGVHDAPLESPDLATNRVGVKLTILGGDFLLGRASAVLPRLGENEVVELVSGIISNIVEGEMLRMEGVKTPRSSVILCQAPLPEAWERYLKKIYFKTASLMAKGARASVVLGGCQDGDVLKEAAYVYGRNIGFAKQVPSARCFIFLRCLQDIFTAHG
jgi:hexaprenyl-diphosphate synthase